MKLGLLPLIFLLDDFILKKENSFNLQRRRLREKLDKFHTVVSQDTSLWVTLYMTQDLIPLLETEKSKQCKNKLLRFVIMNKIMDQVMIKK